MKLRKPCPEHERYDAHLLLNGRETTESGLRMYLLNRGDGGDISVCPGGVFLPDDAGLIHSVIRMWNPDLNDYAVIKCAQEIIDTLAGNAAPEINQAGLW